MGVDYQSLLEPGPDPYSVLLEINCRYYSISLLFPSLLPFLAESSHAKTHTCIGNLGCITRKGDCARLTRPDSLPNEVEYAGCEEKLWDMQRYFQLKL